MQRCNDLAPSLDWQRVLNDGCRTWKKKTMAGVLCRLVLSSVVYNIWKARNAIKYKMLLNLKSRYSSRFFGKLDQEFLEEKSLRKIERMLNFVISGM
jgi:hypothetical protein